MPYPYIDEQDVKDELIGIAMQTKSKQPIPPTLILKKIAYAVSEVERRLDVFLSPVKIAARRVRPESGFARFEPAYDYDPDRFMNWGFTQLRQSPIISVERFVIVTPLGDSSIDLTKYLHVNPEVGQVQIVPGSTAISGAFLTNGGMFLPFGRPVPGVIEIDYTAGMTEEAVESDSTLIEAITKLSAFEVLGLVAQSQGFGAVNFSAAIDGLNKSIAFGQMGPYSDRAQNLITWLQEFFKDGKTNYKGFLMA
jgi:hypothetical protein